MAYNNYTLTNGLLVHAVHVSRTDEDGKVHQDCFWGTMKQIGNPSQVYVRIDIDVLQPMFQGLHYGKETVDELSKCKKRWTAAEKKERTEDERLERQQRDQVAQQRDDVNWEQARIDLWRQKLEERELAVVARESAVFQRELEYRRLERCPLCGRKGQRNDDDGRRTGGDDGAHQQSRQRRRQVIVRRATPRDAEENASVEGCNVLGDRPDAPQLL